MNLNFNHQIPKICVPVTGKNYNEIINQFTKLNFYDFDIAEFRADFFEDIKDLKKVELLLNNIRKIFRKPILLTFRSKNEGGEQELSNVEYYNLYIESMKSKCIDLIDIELFRPKDIIMKLISAAKEQNIKVILSSHDFYSTPSKNEILYRFKIMKEYNADIIKIAVMPLSEEDVLTLLSASFEMKKIGNCPFIAISMGKLGIISRITGELFGSCMTYASALNKSAPGQLNVEDTKKFMNLLHLQ